MTTVTHPDLKKTDPGRWEINQTQVEDLTTEQERGSDGTAYSVQRAIIHMAPMPHKLARNNAVIALILGDNPAGVYEEEARVYNELCDTRKPMTILRARGHGVEAMEGKGYRYNDRPFILNKGSGTKGFYLDDVNPLAVIPGYGKQEQIAETWYRWADQVPQMGKADFDGIPDCGDGDRPDGIAAVYLIDQPNFEGGVDHGLLWFITDIQTEDNIVNGYLWVPQDSSLESEYGSTYTTELPNRGGRVINYEPNSITFEQCMNDLPTTRQAVYARVMGR